MTPTTVTTNIGYSFPVSCYIVKTDKVILCIIFIFHESVNFISTIIESSYWYLRFQSLDKLILLFFQRTLKICIK